MTSGSMRPVDQAGRRSLSGIECVVFDAVGTVIEPVPPAAEMYYRVAGRHGSRLSAALIAARFRAQFRATERGEGPGGEERGLVTSEALERERWRTIVGAVIDDVPAVDACFEELFTHFAQPSAWRIFSDVPPTIAALRNAGIRVALASNFDSRLHAVCDGMPALRDVFPRVISAEVGYRKPAGQFFDALRQATRLAPEKLLMVGDDRQNDVEGAQLAGLAAVLVNRRGTEPEGLRDLRELIAWIGE